MERPFPAYEGSEPYIFVCYSHEDSVEIYPEISRLRDAGFHIWYDEGISPGSEWSDALAKAIKGCSVFLYYVTPRSVVSEHCRREANFALEQACGMLAVHLEPTDLPDGLNLTLSNRQAILRYKHPRAAYETKLGQALHQAETDDFREAAPSTMQIGDWTLDVSIQRLSRGDEEHLLDPKQLSVMLHLIDRAPELVSTEGLLARTWPDVVVGDNVVHQAITHLRRAFGDDARNPSYIETLPKRGYRLLVAVEQATETQQPSDSIEPNRRGAATSVPITQRPLGIAFAIAILLCVAATTWYLLPRESRDTHGADSLAPIRSIAVLPLENLSGDPGQEYVADGMTEELIGELGKLGGLNVISRTSVMRYKDARPSVPEIATELGVDWILEGAVAREGSTIRVTVQLIDAHADIQVWSGRFDRQGSSVLALRSDVARAVAMQLQLNLSKEEHSTLAVSGTVDEAAYDAYLRGLHHRGLLGYVAQWAPKALEELETAVSLDPDFAEAWAQLAFGHVLAGFVERDHFPKARDTAQKALALDSRLGTAHAALGYVAHYYDLDPEAARAAFERAVQLSPNDPTSLIGYGTALVFQERFAERMTVYERLLRVAPLDLRYRTFQIKNFGYARIYDRALEEVVRVQQLWPGFVDNDVVSMYVQLGRFEDAHRARMAYYKQLGAFADGARVAAERGWAEGGFEGELRALAEHWAASVSANRVVTIAWHYAFIGEMDQAFEWLERAIEVRDWNVITMPWHFLYDPMRLDPRFDALLVRLKFPLGPEHPARMADVARLMAFRGRASEAISRLERAMADSPDDPRLSRWLESMAWAHFATTDYERATNWAARVLARDVSIHAAAFANLLLASSYAHLDRVDTAREALAEAMQLWPTLEIDRDLRPLFLGGDGAMRDRYVEGLRKAGLET